MNRESFYQTTILILVAVIILMGVVIFLRKPKKPPVQIPKVSKVPGPLKGGSPLL
jgi:hypothetical protein